MCLVSMLVFNTLTVIASNAALIDVGSSITYLSSPNTTSGDVPLSAVQRKNIVLAAKYIVVGEEVCVLTARSHLRHISYRFAYICLH